MYIIYVNSVHADLFLQDAEFELFREINAQSHVLINQ